MIATPVFGANSLSAAVLALGHIVASFLCWRAWRAETAAADSKVAARAARWWLALAALLALFAAAKLLRVAPQLTELGRHLARAQGWYVRRRVFQGASVLIAVGVALWASRAAVRAAARSSPQLRRALAAGGFLIALVAVRMLSLHHTDALLNLRAGPLVLRDVLEAATLMAVGWAAVHRARAGQTLVQRSMLAAVVLVATAGTIGSTLLAGGGTRTVVKLNGSNAGVASAARIDAVGGGFTAAGLRGEYHDADEPTGTPAFVRRDVRVDFDWGTGRPPGGSTSPGFNRLDGKRFAVRWTGQVVARFSERYTFHVHADDGARLAVRRAGAANWNTLIDAWSSPGHHASPAFEMERSVPYDVRLEYHQARGPARIQLAWSSASTPREVIEPLSVTGVNVATYTGYLGSALWADAMKGGRWQWVDPADESKPVRLDEQGWPTTDAANYTIEGAVQTAGTYHLSFEGSAEVETFPPLTFVAGGARFEGKLPKGAGYDARANQTGATLDLRGEQSLVVFRFRQTQRGPSAPSGSGVRAVRLLRPVTPGATRFVDPGTLFDAGLKSFFEGFTSLRWILNFDKEAKWSARTRPDAAKVNHDGSPTPWEHAIMLSNETGRDLYLCTPVAADHDYLTKLARLVRFGSDARGEPYDRERADAVHPPLNPNLRVYVERGNEIWNWGFSQAGDNSAQARAAVAAGSPDGQLVNFDNKVARDKGDALWARWHALQTKKLSDVFRRVFGDDAMGRRVRVVLEYQYDDLQSSASDAFGFLDLVFANADGVTRSKDPKPISHFLWGAGGATYYGSGNPRGSQTVIKVPNGGFEAPALAANAVARGTASPGWRFEGDAGLFRAPDLRAAWNVREPGRASPGRGGATGMKFTVGPKPVAVYELGRLVAPGNRKPHTVRLIRADDKSTIAEASVEPKGTAVGQTAWARLGHPVQLNAGSTFYLLSEEPAGGDADNAYEDGVLTTDPALQSVTSATATGGGWDVKAWRIFDGGGGKEKGATVRGLGTANARFTLAPVGGENGIGFAPLPSEGSQGAFIGSNGSMTTTIDFGGKPGAYAVEVLVAGRRDAVAPIDFFVDDQRITPFPSGRDPRVNPQPFVGGRWAYDVLDLLPYTTTVFQVSGSHRVRIVGKGKPGEFVYLDRANIVSVGAMFDGGIPAAGEAFGQSAVDNYATQMATQVRYARAFGLAPVAYEGGWSIGGDFGATVVQSHAKYLDPRARGANDQALEMVARAGYAVNVLGTYDLWPTAYEAPSLANRYPLVRSVIESNDRLPATPNVGATAPAVIDGARAGWESKRSGRPGQLTHPGDLAWYGVVAPMTGAYDLAISLDGRGSARVSVDGGTTFSATGPAGGDLVAKGLKLAAGAHGITVQLVSGSATVTRLTVTAPGAPTPPAVRPPSTEAGGILLAWDRVPGATGYRVGHGPAAGSSTDEVDVGDKLSVRLERLPPGQPRYLSVRAYGPSGVSLPSREQVVLPVAPGQVALLAAWSTSGTRGTEAEIQPALTAAGVHASALRRGAGLRPSSFAPQTGAGAFASDARNDRYGSSAEQALRDGQLYELTVGPPAGQMVSLARLTFHAFFQNAGGARDARGAAVIVAGDGIASAAPLVAQGKPSGGASPFTVELSKVPALQQLRGRVTLRLVLHGLAPYEYAGLSGERAVELTGIVR